MSLLLPHVLADRYTLRRRIGGGSFAETYLAIDTHTDSKVAVKALRPEHLDDPEQLTRFEREARTAAPVAHPNVVSIFDHGRDGDIAYIVMEWVDGPDLKTLMHQQGPLPVDQAIRIAQSILAGLSAIHDAGVVHRDIKPQNILIPEDGIAKLTDFGIARCSTDMGLTETGVTLGTAAYMAPEQAIGDGTGPAVDLYAVGVVLFEMLTGHIPFPGDVPVRVMYQHVHVASPRPSLFNPGISPGLDATILRALAKDPAERFVNATAMMAALEEQVLSQQPVPMLGHRFLPSWLVWRDDPVRTLGSLASITAAVLIVLIASMMALASRAGEPVSDGVAAMVDVEGPSSPIFGPLTPPTATPVPAPAEPEPDVPDSQRDRITVQQTEGSSSEAGQKKGDRKPEKRENPEKSEKPEKQEKPEKPGKDNKQEKAEKPNKQKKQKAEKRNKP